MDDIFEIPVDYKGKTLLFAAKLLVYQYSYKIQVDVNGIDVMFEPDEERNYRAVLSSPELVNNHKIDKELIREIAETIEIILKGS